MGKKRSGDKVDKEAKKPKTDAGAPAASKASAVSFGWKELNKAVDAFDFVGNFGGQNGVYQAVAEAQAGKDLNEHHCLRHDQEHMVSEMVELLNTPSIRERWDDVISLNPNGMFAKRPTIAATYARMDMPEIPLVRDGQIVLADGSIALIKSAIEPVWNLPRVAERLKLDEAHMREALFRYTNNPDMKNPDKKVFLPSIGGCTVYFFGDPRKLADPSTQVAVRCHDECNGSDVFCTDICTCRPYLQFAIQGAVECAQRGGVGIVAYFRKEGRALGEVTKFRVYNARKNQEGGDRPEMYFKQTENIAGIRDARLQELMPDVLLWLGIRRIDWLMSMSSDKYDAICAAGIEVLQRVSLPDEYIPRDAQVEISAKISAGYHCEKLEPLSLQKTVSALPTIRERCNKVYNIVKEGHSKFFSLQEDNLSEAVHRVSECLKSSYGSIDKVPYHSRARHFELPDGTDLLQSLFDGLRADKLERARRIIDLTVVSVLTDAGAGKGWTYLDKKRKEYSRSEGLAMLSYEMFVDGMFSSDHAIPTRVNSLGLRNLTVEQFSKCAQISPSNAMIGLEGRVKKLHQLADALDQHPEMFGDECARPGNMVDYLLKQAKSGKGGKKVLSVNALWNLVIEGMETCWPAKKMLGLRNGDVWQCMLLKEPGKPGSDLVPLHKLPQWLMYSLIEVFERFVGVSFTDVELLTGLAEYRNGGLFIDTGVIVMKREEMKTMKYDVGMELIVEWRALTVVLLDKLAEQLRKQYNKTAQQLPLAKVLQAGTWVAGRAVALEKRPEDGRPPIHTNLDGTVF